MLLERMIEFSKNMSCNKYLSRMP